MAGCQDTAPLEERKLGALQNSLVSNTAKPAISVVTTSA